MPIGTHATRPVQQEAVNRRPGLSVAVLRRQGSGPGGWCSNNFLGRLSQIGNGALAADRPQAAHLQHHLRFAALP